MQVTKLPDKTIEQMKQDGFAKPKHCYANSANVVLKKLFVGGQYVLCWMTDSAGGVHGHAVIEAQGSYFDPTLQANSGISTRYVHVQTFTRDELIAFIEQSCGKGSISTGFAPPALLPNGKIACIEV